MDSFGTALLIKHKALCCCGCQPGFKMTGCRDGNGSVYGEGTGVGESQSYRRENCSRLGVAAVVMVVMTVCRCLTASRQRDRLGMSQSVSVRNDITSTSYL